jgi:hypothetical protein
MSWTETALRGLSEKRKNLIEFKKPSNWKWRPRYYKSKLKVLSITIGETAMHWEGKMLVVDTGRLTLDLPEPPTPPEAA